MESKDDLPNFKCDDCMKANGNKCVHDCNGQLGRNILVKGIDEVKDSSGRSMPDECPTCGCGESRGDGFSLVNGSWICDVCGCLSYD